MADTTLPQTVERLEQGIRDGLHIGAQLVVLQEDAVRANVAVGEARPGTPLTPEHLMLWLSAGKPVTAVAIAQQLEQGRLSLDDPVAQHIPGFERHGKDGITIYHLLTHTAGIRTARFNFPDDDWQTIIQAICDARPEPRWTPGEKAGYHPHTSWYLLGEILRRVTGQRFADYLREHIFLPLEMPDCWIGMKSMAFYRYGRRIAEMPSTAVDVPYHEDRPFHTMPYVVNTRPGGNAYGPMRQYANFWQMLLHGGQRPGGPRILKAETVKRLIHRHRAGMFDHTFKHTIDWGLGFILNSYHLGGDDLPYQFGPYASRESFGHGGSQSSIAFADPENRLVVCCNCLGRPGEEMHRNRMNYITSIIFRELNLI